MPRPGGHRRRAPPQHGDDVVDQAAEAPTEPLHETGRPLDVGHQQRDEPRRQGGIVAAARCLQLAGDEPDRHDAEALGSLEQPLARPLAGRVVLERDLPEAGEGVADVGGVVDRQAPSAMGVDVGECPVRERRRARWR